MAVLRAVSRSTWVIYLSFRHDRAGEAPRQWHTIQVSRRAAALSGQFNILKKRRPSLMAVRAAPLRININMFTTLMAVRPRPTTLTIVDYDRLMIY